MQQIYSESKKVLLDWILQNNEVHVSDSKDVYKVWTKFKEMKNGYISSRQDKAEAFVVCIK